MEIPNKECSFSALRNHCLKMDCIGHLEQKNNNQLLVEVISVMSNWNTEGNC